MWQRKYAPSWRDDVDLGGIGEDAGLLVGMQRAVADAAPQRVADIHIFVGAVVALVVIELVEAERAVFAAQMAGDDVPADAAAAEVVERRKRADRR